MKKPIGLDPFYHPTAIRDYMKAEAAARKALSEAPEYEKGFVDAFTDVNINRQQSSQVPSAVVYRMHELRKSIKTIMEKYNINIPIEEFLQRGIEHASSSIQIVKTPLVDIKEHVLQTRKEHGEASLPDYFSGVLNKLPLSEYKKQNCVDNIGNNHQPLSIDDQFGIAEELQVLMARSYGAEVMRQKIESAASVHFVGKELDALVAIREALCLLLPENFGPCDRVPEEYREALDNVNLMNHAYRSATNNRIDPSTDHVDDSGIIADIRTKIPLLARYVNFALTGIHWGSDRPFELLGKNLEYSFDEVSNELRNTTRNRSDVIGSYATNMIVMMNSILVAAPHEGTSWKNIHAIREGIFRDLSLSIHDIYRIGEDPSLIRNHITNRCDLDRIWDTLTRVTRHLIEWTTKTPVQTD